jgi:hypothetical protein
MVLCMRDDVRVWTSGRAATVEPLTLLESVHRSLSLLDRMLVMGLLGLLGELLEALGTEIQKKT